MVMDAIAVEQVSHAAAPPAPTLYDHEFERFRHLIYRIAGIALSPAKKPLVCSRLGKRVRHLGMTSYSEYYRLINDPKEADELQVAVDLLTTNETHFFREPRHFDFFRQRILTAHRRGRTMRVWSAACSSGEEPYTIAMLLDETLGADPWEVVGTDLSTRVLEKARRGSYPEERVPEIPRHYLSRYCLKGQGSKAGTMLIEKKLRDRVQFFQHNLTSPPPPLGEFDVIFLRNVLIYFDQETKRQVVERLLPLLKKGGHFLVSHSETLSDISTSLNLVAPSIYRKPE